MTSRIETGEGAKSLPATATGVLQQRSRFDQNYGAMTTVMGYLTRLEQLKMQGLDTWQYDVGVSRVQVRLVWPELFYLIDEREPQILEISETGESQRFDCRGESDFSNGGWNSCQVGRSRLFQAKGGSFRFLKIDRSQRSFTVEREQARPELEQVQCLANLKDQFIFLFCTDKPRRYSISKDRWEKLPPCETTFPRSSCSLADKVYVLEWLRGTKKNRIHVLHNPGASIPSQELHWQVIEVPQNMVTSRLDYAAFVPLNSTEIVILGGRDRDVGLVRDARTFNTATYEFKKELEDNTVRFICKRNQSAQVCRNIVIALVTGQNDKTHLTKYKKGDTCVTNIQE